ncbi:MAG: hypothetical protein Q7J27_09585 [Syntrophales bacterium]|nr:hypothetical protein [Syntrophales bacterium]
MEIIEKVSEEKEVVVGLVCNKCKKEFGKDDFLELQEFHRIRFVGGYGSVFGDAAEIECDLCQHCLKKLIDGIYNEI